MLRKIVSALGGHRRPHLPYSLENSEARRRAWWHYHVNDHGFLRYTWTNFDEIAPGAYRCNHPHATRLRSYKDLGICAVLNLRGENDNPSYLMEVAACEALDLHLVSVKFAARVAPRREKLLELFDAFDRIPRPFVMHCKSGADRAGIAAALYLLDQGFSMKDARRHLSLRYLHLRITRTGVQDTVLDLFEERLAQGPLSLRDWVRDEYDRDAVTARFASYFRLPL